MNIKNPLDARNWFFWKFWKDMAICFAVFLVVAAPFYFFGYYLLFGILLSVTIACALYFLWLERRTLTIECPSCHKFIDTGRTPWECGYKNCANENLYDFPFINKCENCKHEPKAYKCHHCDKLIFLSIDQVKANYAKHLTRAKLVPPIRKDPISEKIANQREDLRDLGHKLNKEKYRTEIEIEKRRRMNPEEESHYDKVFADIKRLVDEKMVEEQVIDHLEKFYKKTYAHNPDLLNKYLAWLHMIAQDIFEKRRD